MKSFSQFILEKKMTPGPNPGEKDSTADLLKNKGKRGELANSQGELNLKGDLKGKSSKVPSGPPPSGEKVNRGPGRPVDSKNKSKGPKIKQGELDFSSKGAGSGNIGGKETEFRSTSGKNNPNQKPQKPSDVIKGAEQSAQGQKARTDAIKGGANKQPSASEIKSAKGKINQSTLFNRLTGRYSRSATRQGEKPQEPRRRTGKSVAQIKAEIEAKDKAIADRKEAKRKLKLKNTTVKSSTIKGNKPPTLPTPTPVSTGKKPLTNPQSMLRTPRKSTPKFDSAYNKKGDANLRKLLGKGKRSDYLRGGGPAQVGDPWKSTDYIDPPKKTEVIDQGEVSKKASKFTKDTNTARIEKLSKGRVKIDYGMSKPEKGEILRSVDKRPKVKTQLSPDTIRSTYPKSDINTTYDKAKASRTFKDMASDSKKRLSSKGIVGKSKESVKNLTNKISRSLGFKSKVKSTPKVTKVPKNKLFQRLNITRKKGLRTFKGTGPGVFYGLGAYTKQREAGAGIKRSTGGAVTSAATSGLTWKYASRLLTKLAKPKGLVGNLVNYGLSGALAWKVGDETLKAYDATLGPTKGKNPPKKKVAVPLVPFGGSKKKKKLDFGNYSFSFAGDSRINKKDKK